MASDSFRENNYAMPWRTAFEAGATLVWLLCALISLVFVYVSHYPAIPFYVVAIVSFGFALYRALEAADIWNLRINLLGKGMLLTPLASYVQHAAERPNDLWLGKGFRWEKHHSQRLYDIRRTDHENVMPPPWYANLRGMVFDQQPENFAGMPWIHGVGDGEEDIHLPFTLLEGNSLIVGTTGSGKSTLLRCIIAACIRRGDCVILIDPKGDKTLVDTMRDSCALTPGRQNDFVYFHTAFAQQSVRYDILRNFDRVTSIASRISAQVPSKTGFDQFVAFAWDVLLVNAMLLIVCGDRPTISKIRRNIQTGIEPLLERALTLYLDHVRPVVWRTECEKYVDMSKNDKVAKPTRTTSDRLAGYVEYYKTVIAPLTPSEAIDAGIGTFFHDRGHFGKMISSLKPTLAMLDSGELGALLSPRYDDIEDPRTIYDSDRIVEGNKCMYIGLDALSDSVVSSAIGSIIVADLAAVAGARYNYGTEPRRITLIVDEANEVVSAPFHQLASKGRGSGFSVWAASQTIPDYIARLGSQEKAMATLGNFNNLICLRIKDTMTRLFVSEHFGSAFVDSRSYGLNTSSQSDAAATGFTGGEGVTVKDQLMEVIPPDLLGMLPNHQYFALLAGGKLYKGRQPVLSA